MRTIAALVLGSLVAAGCAPKVGAFRADDVDPSTPARIAGAGPAHVDGREERGRLDDADEVVGCLAQAVVIGGAAAAIYLGRFRDRGGGGGEVAEALRPPAPADRAAPVDPVLAEVEAIVGDGVFRPCGAICGGAPAAASR